MYGKQLDDLKNRHQIPVFVFISSTPLDVIMHRRMRYIQSGHVERLLFGMILEMKSC